MGALIPWSQITHLSVKSHSGIAPDPALTSIYHGVRDPRIHETPNLDSDAEFPHAEFRFSKLKYNLIRRRGSAVTSYELLDNFMV